jgi:hypothetical protein
MPKNLEKSWNLRDRTPSMGNPTNPTHWWRTKASRISVSEKCENTRVFFASTIQRNLTNFSFAILHRVQSLRSRRATPQYLQSQSTQHLWPIHAVRKLQPFYRVVCASWITTHACTTLTMRMRTITKNGNPNPPSSESPHADKCQIFQDEID